MKDTMAAIKRAFRDVEKPTDETQVALHPCTDCEELARDLFPHTWETLPRELLEHHSDDLPILTPQALRYYLPAYLLYALEFPTSLVLELTVYHLTPTKEDIAESNGYFEERFALFSPEQRAAIGAFFADVREHQLFPFEGQGELERAKYLWPD
jgi:hypothetical protein